MAHDFRRKTLIPRCFSPSIESPGIPYSPLESTPVVGHFGDGPLLPFEVLSQMSVLFPPDVSNKACFDRAPGGDIIWQIGTGYFGCRNDDGTFNVDLFAEQAVEEQIKMIELKVSQGAKPGHGGILPGAKVTAEIAAARKVPVGVDCFSPPGHSAFKTPVEMMEFIALLRNKCGGKPVGFKTCIGNPREFYAICKAMMSTGITPDFITVDGAEGGTGAAPIEFSNHVGMPLREALIFVHGSLVGFNLRDRARIAASGKRIDSYAIATAMALGADWINIARGFMLAVGCIQSQSCHSDKCPVGVATFEDGTLVFGATLIFTDRVTGFAGGLRKYFGPSSSVASWPNSSNT